MGKVETIQEAIINAYGNESKLTEEILGLPSFSSFKIRHLLNNLGSISKFYIEVGIHKAGGFISTLYGNDCVGLGIDNWSQLEQDGLSKKLAYFYCEHYLLKEKYSIYEGNCFEIELITNVYDMLNYDGEHGFENQYNGVKHFVPFMANEFILTVDDTNWEAPRIATLKAIEDLKLEILYRKHLTDGKDNGIWHNGVDVFYLKKTI